MNEKAIHNEYDLLTGEMNRMFVTDDAAELEVLHDYAKKRIDRIYEYHFERLNNKC